MVFVPRRRPPSAKGRPDAHLLVPARVAIVVAVGGVWPLGWLDVWMARGVILAATGVLLWARLRSSHVPDPDGELRFTTDFGSLVLGFVMLLTGLTPLVAVPLGLFVFGLGQVIVQALAIRRRERARRDRKARAREHFARKKARRNTTGSGTGGRTG